MDGQIFISYRRKDSDHAAGRIYDRLKAFFGDDKVFIDVDNIPPGQNFKRKIEEKVSECDVLLAIVGPHWLNISDIKGGRRLEDPKDLVRMEIVFALRRKIPVFPILLGDAMMPNRDELPKELKPFCELNAIEISHPRFDTDVQRLIRVLKETLMNIEKNKAEERKQQRETEAANQRKTDEQARLDAIKEDNKKKEEQARAKQMEEERNRKSEAAEKRQMEAQAGQKKLEEEKIKEVSLATSVNSGATGKEPAKGSIDTGETWTFLGEVLSFGVVLAVIVTGVRGEEYGSSAMISTSLICFAISLVLGFILKMIFRDP